jgi:hypothetical protein
MFGFELLLMASSLQLKGALQESLIWASVTGAGGRAGGSPGSGTGSPRGGRSGGGGGGSRGSGVCAVKLGALSAGVSAGGVGSSRDRRDCLGWMPTQEEVPTLGVVGKPCLWISQDGIRGRDLGTECVNKSPAQGYNGGEEVVSIP